MLACVFHMMRRDQVRAASNALEVARLAREHDLTTWRAFGVYLESWATVENGDPEVALQNMHRGAELLREQNMSMFDGLFKIALAEIECRAGDLGGAVATIDEALAICESTGQRAFEAELHRVRAELLLERDPANLAPAEETCKAAIAVAREQGARSFELRAALSLAQLYQSTARPAEAHAVLTPAVEGFSPTSEMPEIAEAQALLAVLAETEEVKAEGERRQRRQHLQVSYGNALIAERGFGAAETTEAFARARKSVAKDNEWLAADYGLWVGSFARGELPTMRAYAADFLADVTARPNSPEAGVAHGAQGATHWVAGEYVEARHHLECALSLFEPGRDDDLAFRFGVDRGVAPMSFLAFVLWSLGELDQAVSLVERMNARMADLTHANTLALGAMHASMFELMRGDRSRARTNAIELVRIVIEHEDLHLFRAFGEFLEGWVTADSGALAEGLENMRRGAESLREQNVLVFDGLIKIALSETETRAGDLERAIATLDEALATVERTGYRAFEAELHRARGEMLLRRDPADFATAEQALQTAVAIARQQGTRSFELRATLPLAKLYQSTGRPVDAHATLAPALEGFSPTPEMPEIAEAQALLAALAKTEEVKAVETQRQRRLDLQRSYGHALIWGKGYGAEETMAAFARVGELAGPTENYAARFAAYDAQSLGSFIRGEYAQTRETAETFLREAMAEGRATEAGVARRMLGLVCVVQGDLKTGRSVLERALADYVPERDADTQLRFGRDTQVSASAYLALAEWHLGEVERARHLINQAARRADQLGHAAVVANALVWKAAVESRRDDVLGTSRAAALLLDLAEKHNIKTYVGYGELYANWAHGRLLDPDAGANGLRQALGAYMAQGNKSGAPIFYGLLAELEATTLGPDAALTLIDQGLAIARETGEHFTDPCLHRLRGEILLRRDPANPVPAEGAFQTAVAIAKEQGARSYQLLASLSLAKLYQSTDRLVDAHSVLAPALEGFSPTPEMPEIAEAQALLESLAHGGEEVIASKDQPTQG
jgi:predicted ATPase